MRLLVLFGLVLFSLSPVSLAVAAPCPEASVSAGETLARAWREHEPVAAPGVEDLPAARCIQVAMVAALDDVLGPRAGWKVGLASEAVQRRFGADQPVAGVLPGDRLYPDGAELNRAFGARPMVEADLVVRVADAAIMRATSRREVLGHLDAVIPFIELVDLMVVPGEPLNSPVITAFNVGARGGVLGAPVPVTEAMLESLGGMRVEVRDGGGRALGEYPGAAILGHPLDAVRWLIGELEARGESLRAGDLLSLGSFGPPLAVDSLDGLHVRYHGLVPHAVPEVSLGLRDD